VSVGSAILPDVHFSLRRTAGVLAAALLALPLAGCGLFGDSEPLPEDVADGYLGAFAKGDSGAAADLTDSPESAKALLSELRGELDPEAVSAQLGKVETSDTSAKASFDVAWDFGHDRRWEYEGRIELRNLDGAWKVHWSTTVVHPELAEQQSIAVQNEQPELAPVLDRDGDLLMSPDRVVSVLFEPAKAGGASSANAVAGSLATVLAGYDGSITQKSVLAGAKKSGDQPYQVIALRSTDYERVKPRIYDLPGVRFTAAPRLLPADKRLAPTLLPGIRKLVEDDLIGKSGWRVITTDESGAEIAELYSKAAEPAEAARVTLSVKTQNAAQAALAAERNASMLVAIQPSTGELLAVAQNPAADKQGAVALTGRYPPGSTFKIVTAIAGIEAGKAQPNARVGCPGTITIDGRVVPNNDKFDKGVIPLHSAFAFSCNTTFAELATKLDPSALTDTALRLGLGVDFVMRGATTVTGSVPPASDVVERAEDGFGQGKVVASPFGMALVASTVASGTMPTPTLLAGSSTESDVEDPEPLDPKILASMRSMMQEVTQRTPALAPYPDTRGKTGTAQFGDGKHAHGWYVGFRGDLAFAVLITDAGKSSRAVSAATRFFAGLR
jgi:cell division protein FtsI/penicillin-binding protein 2